MRKITKTKEVPKPLLGVNPPAIDDDIDKKVYGHEEVKNRLRYDQYNKCAYCECSLNGDYGDVEHYRPKEGYSIYPNGCLHRPGYYWLAYNWDNLLLSCSVCDRTYKRNHFLLAEEKTRNIAKQDISAEVPLLINPAQEDPEMYLVYHEHILAPRMIGNCDSQKGIHTIELLQLNKRPALVEERRRKYEEFMRWKLVMALAHKIGLNTPEDYELQRLAQEGIAALKSPSAEYSAMFLDL